MFVRPANGLIGFDPNKFPFDHAPGEFAGFFAKCLDGLLRTIHFGRIDA